MPWVYVVFDDAYEVRWCRCETADRVVVALSSVHDRVAVHEYGIDDIDPIVRVVDCADGIDRDAALVVSIDHFHEAVCGPGGHARVDIDRTGVGDRVAARFEQFGRDRIRVAVVDVHEVTRPSTRPPTLVPPPLKYFTAIAVGVRRDCRR